MSAQCHKTYLDIFREDGIMFNVNILQWILEVLFMILLNLKIYASDDGFNALQERIWHIYVSVHIHLVNAFYLLGDSEFLRSVTEVGIIKSLQRAFLQSY